MFLASESGAAPSIQDSLFLPNKDPAKWPEIINDNLIDCYLEKGAEYFQNCDSDKKFEASLRTYKSQNRKFSESMLYKILVNGETVRRQWILYSLSTGNICCFSCKIFNYNKSSPFCCGFSDWKKGPEKIEHHENSKEHRISMNKLLSRMDSKQRVDKNIAEAFQREKIYWTDVFKRIVVVIKFLAERGLPFRGDDEIFGSTSNGLYMGMLEIIAKFDPLLDNHIKNYGNKGKGNVSYLSKTICEEFIKLMSEKVLKKIIGDIIASKYYSIIVDSTPDLSHVDQLSIIIRYCSSEKGGQVHERFLGFVPIFSHTGKSLSEVVINFLTKNTLELKFCRGQSYDNASNMSGQYNGLQAHIQENAKVAFYVPCFAHSLNLVGECAVDECLDATKFFNFLQKLYAFFGASTHRWHLLLNQIDKNLTVKSLSTTRWSCREDAAKALVTSYVQINNCLNMMSDDPAEKKDTKLEAIGLSKQMKKMETLVMATFWNKILRLFGETSKILQKPGLDLLFGENILKGLIANISCFRDQFDLLEEQAKHLLPQEEYEYSMGRSKRQKKYPDGKNDMPSNEKEIFRTQTFLVIIDKLVNELQRRCNAYSDLSKLFGLISKFNSDLTRAEIEEFSTKVSDVYKDDLNGNLTDELVFFSELLRNSKIKPCNPLDFLRYILKNQLIDTFPNVYTILRIYLSIPITNCESERSFSKLVYIKNKYRTTMQEERLSSLTLMCIERDVLKELEFDDVIQEFVKLKLRKKVF